jgi:outer membrane protein assembly factor BamE (lipoprotein component of BamABCDE complex)
MKNLFLVFMALFFLFGCTSKNSREIIVMKKVGTPEQKTTQAMKHEILIGMSQEDVRKALGSPDIVAKDKAGKEMWVLSRIAASIRDIKKNGTTSILVKTADASEKKKETPQTQGELLTIVINFDKDKNVESFSYH